MNQHNIIPFDHSYFTVTIDRPTSQNTLYLNTPQKTKNPVWSNDEYIYHTQRLEPSLTWIIGALLRADVIDQI